MKKRVFAVLAALTIVLMLFSACNKEEEQKSTERTAVDEKYAYNTQIPRNGKAPTAGKVDLKSIDGYVAGSVKGLKLPYRVKDTHLVIESAGSYTGKYVEDLSMDSCKDIASLIVRNDSDSVISYSSFSVQYGTGEDDACNFTATNIPAGRSALLLSSRKDLRFDRLRQFKITDSMEVCSESLTVLDGTVGLDYDDDRFILTNLTDERLGTVYIRYKFLTSGNAYLGGVTGSAYTSGVEPYGTYFAEQKTFDPDGCEILCVENDDSMLKK